jgi:hypothetical protein
LRNLSLLEDAYRFGGLAEPLGLSRLYLNEANSPFIFCDNIYLA